MSGFSDPILTGDGTLIRAAEKSVDYAPGAAGWQIERDGDAEFNNLTARGTIEARNGNAVIQITPSGPAINLNPNDTLYANGSITITDNSGNSAELTITAPEATTGNGPFISLISGQTGTAEVGTIDLSADSLVFNGIDITPSDWGTWTPAWTNIGTATFTTNSGYYKRFGDIYFINLYAVVNAGGSGVTPVTVTGPVNINRTNRQSLGATMERTGGTQFLSGFAVALVGGSGAVIDRIRIQDGGAADASLNLQGSFMTAGAVINIQGWLRSA